MRKLHPVEVTAHDQAARHALPEAVAAALGELVGAAQEGLLALSVGVGLGVLESLMEEERTALVDPRSKPNAERTAVRHGHESGEVTLGGRRVAVRRPRARSTDGSTEIPLTTYEHFADRDPLTRAVLERMLAGVSTRRYRRTQEPVGEQVEQEARSTSKSAVSRAFVERTREALAELMARQLDDVRLAVVMLDGIELKGRTNVVCLGITTEGVKISLGLWEGSSENATVATSTKLSVTNGHSFSHHALGSRADHEPALATKILPIENAGPIGAPSAKYSPVASPSANAIGSSLRMSTLPSSSRQPSSILTSLISPMNWVCRPSSCTWTTAHSTTSGNSATQGASTNSAATGVSPAAANLSVSRPETKPKESA